MRYLILSLLIVQTSESTAQVLTRKVDLSVKFIPLEDLLSQLQQDYQLKFSYGFDNVTGKMPVTIIAKNVTLYYVIQEAGRQADLDFIVIGSMVVFKQRPILPKSIGAIAETNHSASVDSIATDTLTHHEQEYRISNRASLATSIFRLKPLPPILRTSTAVAARSRIARWGLVVKYDVDINNYDFKIRVPEFQQYDRQINSNVGIGFFYRITNRLYVSTGLFWTKKDFTLHYNYQVFDPDDPFPIPEQTRVTFQHIEVPLVFAVPVFTSTNNWILLLTGVSYSSQVGRKEKTSYLNSAPVSTNHFANSSNSSLYGATAGLTLEHRLTPQSTIFFQPAFIIYQSALSEAAMKSYPTAVRITAGVTYHVIKTENPQNR